MRMQTTLPHVRPRERLLQYGGESLSIRELWMCILGSGTQNFPVEQQAKELEEWWRSHQSGTPFFRDLGSWRGRFGPAQTARALAIAELFRRLEQRSTYTLTSPTKVQEFCQEMAFAQKESLCVLYCATDATLLHKETVALGGLNVAYVAPRDVFYPLRLYPADSLVLCHNHPSGNPEPSSQDLVFTKRIEASCQLLGLWLRDHVIVAKDKLYSFRENGLLQPV